MDSLRLVHVPVQPLHGDPHIDGNCCARLRDPCSLTSRQLASARRSGTYHHSVESVASFYPPIDTELLEILSLTRSVCVATWCWMQPERAPEDEEGAHFHLSPLRKEVQ